VLQWIVWLLFSSILNTYYYCSTHFVLQWIVWLLFSSTLNTRCYCSTHLVLQWIVWLLFSSNLNICCYCSTHLVLHWNVWLIQFCSQYILLLFLTLSGTELHALRPTYCFHLLTESDFILDMFFIIKVWCITLTVPLPSHLIILAMLQSILYDFLLHNNLRTTNTAVGRVLLHCVAGTRHRLQCV